VLWTDVGESAPVVVRQSCQTLEAHVAELLPSLARLQSVAPVPPTDAVAFHSTLLWFRSTVYVSHATVSVVR